MPQTPSNLVAMGFSAQPVGNEAPDWQLIYAMIGFFIVLLLLLVLAVIIWLPRHAGLHPMLHWAPKYRSLGKPPPVPHYLRYDPDHWPEKPTDDVRESLGPRVVGDGAEADLMSAPTFAEKGGTKAVEGDLEDFNVRVLYDKLEDQNLHLAAQLARQQEDLRNFYHQINEQNEGLKNLLMNMDPTKLEELEQKLEARQREKERLVGSGGPDGGPTIVNASLAMGGEGKYKFAGAGAGGRDAELMAALQLLLDRLNSGNIPINKSVLEQLQKGGTGTPGVTTETTNVTYAEPAGGSMASKAWASLLGKQNSERLKLERDLLKEEQEALAQFAHDEEKKRHNTMDTMTDSLVSNLSGGKAAVVADIMNQHSKNLEDVMNKHNNSKGRQADELHRKLLMRRRARQDALREKQRKEAEEAGLPVAPERFDASDVKLQTTQSVLDTLESEEAAGMARTKTDLEENLGAEERKQRTEKMMEHLDRMAGQSVISQELRDQLVKQHREAESALANVHEARKQAQLKTLHEKMAQRRKKRFDRLRDDQEKRKNEMQARMIQEGRNDELERELQALKRLFDQEMSAAEAEMDAEENEHVYKLSRTLNDEHTSGLKEAQRGMMKRVTDECPASEKVAMQRLMDQHRQDLESIEQDLSLEKDRQLNDLQAKLQARRARRLTEAQRKAEEEEAQRIIAEQRKQMQQKPADKESDTGPAVPMDTGLLRNPTVNLQESTEEQALKKDQERNKDDIRKQQKKEFDKLADKLEQEGQRQEDDIKKQMNGDQDKMLREMKNKHAAELAARPDLSQDQIDALMAQHEHDLEELRERMENDKQRQLHQFREKMANRRMRKLDDLRRKQEVDLTKEMLEQKKELNEIRLKNAKVAERKAIKEGIKDNGADESEKVIKAVLAQRQAQEMADLEKQFAAEKKMMVDDALNKLNDKYDRLRDEMMKRHDQELADLQKLGLSPEELQQRRAELLAKHQQELSGLDRRHASEKGDVERNALAEWELRFAKAKLALKEKHYKEFAEALREFTPDKQNATDAEQSALELQDVKRRLEQERRQQEEQLKKEEQEFERDEQRRMEQQMAEYAKQLEGDTAKEKEKHEKNLETLNKRKEEMIREKKNKMKEEVDRLRNEGASENEQRQLLKQHEKDLQQLVNKIDADKLRMQSTLQERLKKRKEEKLKAKQVELINNADDAKRELEQKQQSQMQRMKVDEALTLNEALNMDTATARADSRPTSHEGRPSSPTTSQRVEDQEEATPDLPSGYNMTAPLNEKELMDLLLASPLYQKLENIKSQIEKGAHKGDTKDKIDSDGFQDAKDSEWTSDSKLVPVDLNKLDARKFIVYKFGCFVTELVSTHCQHAPVTILLADKIPPNDRLKRNPYRNSFFFDANNNILYVRTARLDTVGEFVVVLVHTLAHIKSGDLRDDQNPDFLREYHRALAVVCDDLFFARFRRNTTGSIKNEPSTEGAVRLLQQMFGDCHTEDEKIKMVEDLLDVKLLPSTNKEGVHFNADRIRDRLSKYSSFSMTNKLHTMLGSMEEKVHQAKAQGTTHKVDKSLLALSHKYTPNGPTPLNRKLPLRFVTANMTGHALWQTFANHAESDETGGESMPPPKSPEDIYDDLCADFTDVNKSIIDMKEKIKQLTEETSATGKSQKSRPDEKLTEMKAELTRLEMEKKLILDKMEEKS